MTTTATDRGAKEATARPRLHHDAGQRLGPGLVQVRDASLFVDVIGSGHPLALMHGGPSADHWTMMPFRRLADRFTLVFYDHRCNGRSKGAHISSMTWDNLTADADALRERLGFERWAVLGHSFGGEVALEYALRYPTRLSHLILLDSGGDSRWSRENAPEVLARRGYSAAKVEAARRWFNGEFTAKEYLGIFMAIGDAYLHEPKPWLLLRDIMRGEWRAKMRPEALIFAGRHLLPGWSVMDRLGEITVPTLLIAGRDDFIFPPEHQAELASALPNATVHIVEHAGHNAHSEQPDEVMEAVSRFLSAGDGSTGHAHDVAST